MTSFLLTLGVILAIGIVNGQHDTIQQQRVQAKPCASLNGVWYNHNGGRMNFLHGADGSLRGTYRSAVALGSTHSPLDDDEDHPLTSAISGSAATTGIFSFQVIWTNSTTITGWTGQCQFCDGEEKLFTTWILTEKQATCGDLWKANRIGQTTFTRSRPGSVL